MDNQERTEWRIALFAFFAVGLPIFIGFAIWGDFGRGRSAMVAAGAVVSAASSFWDQRRKLWFWVVLCLVSVVHAMLVMEIPWSDRPLNYWQLLPFGFGDAIAVFCVFKLVHKVMTRVRSQSKNSA